LVEELLTERGIAVDHVTICRWVRILTPAFVDAAHSVRHAIGDGRGQAVGPVAAWCGAASV